jgi:hypothetical protein
MPPRTAQKGRSIALEMERQAAALQPKPVVRRTPEGEALAMLARRGFTPMPARPDLAFPSDLADATADELAQLLGHYAFRLFLRAAILSGPFDPASMTRYLTAAQAFDLAEKLAALGLAKRLPEQKYSLAHPARSFGGTLEWYVAHELRRRFAFDVAVGLKLRGEGSGGDLDVVAAAEGKLVYIELKSSPPKYLTPAEVGAFFGRVRALRPDVSLFAMDTALRLSDKVVPMLEQELPRGPAPESTRAARVKRELWAITPHIYAVNAQPDLIANIGRAIAEGLRALAPPAP